MKVAQKINWKPPAKKLKPRRGPLPPSPIRPMYIYQSTGLDVSIPNILYLADLTRAVQKLCFLTPPVIDAYFYHNS